MIKMLGESRVLDSAVSETGESSARKINLFGVKSLSELQDKPLLVKSNFDGVTSTTIQINELEAKQVKVFKNNSVVDLYNHWIASGQLYMLMYNGVVFIAFPLGVSSSEGGGGSTGMDILSIPIQVTNLQDGDNESTILSAFGNEDAELALQDYISQDLGIIAFGDTTLPGYKLYLLETYTTNDTPKSDVLRFIKCINDNYIIVTLKLNRKNSEELPLYESVEVSEFNISEVIDTIPGEGENITLNDTADAKFTKFRIEGNSKQETTEGYNLLNVPAEYTILSTEVYKKVPISLKANHTYTIKIGQINTDNTDVTSVLFNFIYNEVEISNSYAYVKLSDLKGTYTPASDVDAVFIYSGDSYAQGAKTNTTYKNLMIYEGTDDKQYEQYGSSPSLNYPNEIQNVKGNINIKITNENNDKQQAIIFPLAENQKLMKDDYLAEDGIHHKRKQIVIDNNCTIWNVTIQNNELIFANIAVAGITTGYYDKTPLKICNLFKNFYSLGNMQNDNLNTVGCALYSQQIWIRSENVYGITTEDSAETRISKVKLYLEKQNLIAEYELAEEEVEPYTDEQKAVYDEIKKTAHSYGEQTHVFSTDEVSPIFDVEAYKKSNSIDNVISLIAKYADSAVYLYAPKISNITVLSSEWIINSETNKYEYTKSDDNITNKHLIEIFMDLENQAKIADGYVESYDGGYKIITSTKPTEDINMTLKIQLTV